MGALENRECNRREESVLASSNAEGVKHETGRDQYSSVAVNSWKGGGGRMDVSA